MTYQVQIFSRRRGCYIDLGPESRFATKEEAEAKAEQHRQETRAGLGRAGVFRVIEK